MDWNGCSCLLFGTNSYVMLIAYILVYGIQYRLRPFLRAIVIGILESDILIQSESNILFIRALFL